MTVSYAKPAAEAAFQRANGSAERTRAVLRIDAFEIDLDCFELRRDGCRVETQPLIFDLFVYLLCNRDRVVTRDELIGSVWRGTIVADGAIHQAVSLLRKTIAGAPDNGLLLKTVRKRGYMLTTTGCSAGRTTESPRSCRTDAADPTADRTTRSSPRHEEPFERVGGTVRSVSSP